MAHDLAIIFRIFPSVSQSLGSARLCPPATAASGNLERLEPVSCAAFFIQSPATCVQMGVEYSMKTTKIVRSHSPKSWFMGFMLCPQSLKKTPMGVYFYAFVSRKEAMAMLCCCWKLKTDAVLTCTNSIESAQSCGIQKYRPVQILRELGNRRDVIF